jgi:hypothetical protein
MILEVHTETLEVLESKVESTELKGTSLFVTAVGLTKDFVPPKLMKEKAWTFKGKECRWRHKLPEKDPKNLIGHIHEAFVENEQLKFIYEIWGYRDDLVKIQEQIKKNEVSISAGYRKITNQKNEVVDFYGRELSVTPFPKCTNDMGCGNEMIIANEDKKNKSKEIKMPDENKEAFNLLKEQIAKNEKVIKQLEETNVKLANERGEQIIRLESTISALESKISEQNELITEQVEELSEKDKKLDEKDKELAQSKKMPLVLEIVKLEQITEKEAILEEVNELIEFNESQLTKMKSRLERAAKIAQKTAPNRQTPALGESNQQNDDLDSLSPEQLSARLDPQLKDFIAQNERASGRNPSPYSTNQKEDGVPMI